MEAILFFILLVAALLVLNIIDMVSSRSKSRMAPEPPGIAAPPVEPPLVDSTGRPLHGPALARARAARRAARATEARSEPSPPAAAESAGK